MGQDHSSGKRGQEAEAYGNVFVKLDQDTYLSDDTVTGTIYVQLRRPYPGDKICIKVKGKEFTKWIDKEHKQRQREDGTIEHYTVDVPREAEFVPVKHVVDLYDWRNGSVIPPGQFSFPVSFKIPPGLPSTFFLRSGTTVAEISYYVEAYLKPEKELYPKIKHKRPITIRQALRGDITTKEVSINQEVSTCCCLSKGSVAMWTAFEKNAYAPGEEARIVTEVDNSKCELAITNVRFELVQYIKLTAQNNSKALHFGIVGENLGRVEPGQSFLKDQRKEASIHLPPGIEGSAKAYKGDNQVQEYNITPQQAISPSTNGNLVKSNFGLRVACGMDGCVCDTMPTTELPVTIYSIIQRKVADPLPPPGWNPTPMPASNISIIISINGVAPGTISTGPAQPQGNTLMSNNQIPPQQTQYTQQSQAQQPLSNRQQESQYPQSQAQYQQEYRQQEQRPQYQQQTISQSQAQSLQSIQSKPQYPQESQYQQQYQQESQYRQQESPLRQSQEAQYQQYRQQEQRSPQRQQSQSQFQESQYRQQEQAQYQQPLSNRQSESQYQQQSIQRQPQPQSQSQIQIQPKQQYQQESQYRQQESPLRQSQEAQYQQYRQQEQRSPQRQQSQSQFQESQYRQQEQSPPRQQYQQEYQQQQSPQRQQYKQESQYRQQEQPQYQPNRTQESQYQQQQSPQRYQQEAQYRQQQSPLRQSQSQYQLQESQSRHQEQSPPRQQYQQEYQQQQSPQRYQQESQYRQQEQAQYQSNRTQESQYQQQQSPQRYQQESQYRQQEQSPPRQQYQQESQYRQQQSNYQPQGQQYGRGERY